jgi:glyoxylase-like metal-dependent hydrolase (beta-lactamase superfamily II)
VRSPFSRHRRPEVHLVRTRRYLAVEIAGGVYSIGQTGRNTYPSGYSHAYLLKHGQDLTLIDTLGDADGRLVLQQLRRLGQPVRNLKQILLTHAHRSHIGGLAHLKSLSGATVYSHVWEADIISGKRSAQPVPLLPIRPLRVYPQRLGLALGAGHPHCHVDKHLSDGDEVGPIHVIHTPGHTPGHLVFYWPERQALFTGDNVVTWPRLGAGWPGFQLDEMQFRDSLQHMEESVLRIGEQYDQPVSVIGVAHGEPITRGATERLRFVVEAAQIGRFAG